MTSPQTLGKRHVMIVHAALHRVRRRLEALDILERDALAAYDAHGVTPQRVDATRGQHAKAVLLLAEALAGHREHPTPSSADIRTTETTS